MDTLTNQHGLRSRVGRFSAVAAAFVALLTFGLGSVASANTVHTPTGQSFALESSGAGGGYIATIHLSGSGFASGGKIRIVVRYREITRVDRLSVTADRTGQFSLNLKLSVHAFPCTARCHSTLGVDEHTGHAYSTAYQDSPTRITTPRATTTVVGHGSARY